MQSYRNKVTVFICVALVSLLTACIKKVTSTSESSPNTSASKGNVAAGVGILGHPMLLWFLPTRNPEYACWYITKGKPDQVKSMSPVEIIAESEPFDNSVGMVLGVARGGTTGRFSWGPLAHRDLRKALETAGKPLTSDWILPFIAYKCSGLVMPGPPLLKAVNVGSCLFGVATAAGVSIYEITIGKQERKHGEESKEHIAGAMQTLDSKQFDFLKDVLVAEGQQAQEHITLESARSYCPSPAEALGRFRSTFPSKAYFK